MGFHTYDPDRADELEDVSRFEYLSVDELLALVDPGPEETLLDVGSGTGFYTDHVARDAGRILALDVQQAMNVTYRAKGTPPNVHPVTGTTEDLPVADGSIDTAFSTMTYHEFATERSLNELARVLRPDGRLAIADWTRNGEGTSGPPLDERYDADTAVDHLERAGFTVEYVSERRDTFLLSARL